MNDDLDENSTINNFILERVLKSNASGMVVTGIYHNFALNQN